MATTLFTGAPVFDRGVRTHAKSRAGSQISVTALGKYPAARVTNVEDTVCDVRLIKDIQFGFLARAAVVLAKSGVEMSLRLVFASDDAEGEPLRSRTLRSGDRLWSVSWVGEAGSVLVFDAAA